MSIRQERVNGSLDSSWGDADYHSDDGDSNYSLNSAESELESEASDAEVVQDRPEMAAPLSTRTKNRRTGQSAYMNSSDPVVKESGVRSTRQSQTLDSSPSTPRTAKRAHVTPRRTEVEPRFIMPSMDNSPSRSTGDSFAQGSKVRQRQLRQSQLHASANASPRRTNRKATLTGTNRTKQQETEAVSPWHYVSLFWDNVAWPLIGHFLDIFSYALRHFIKPILGVALGVGILVFSIQLVGGIVRSSISNALMAPVCLIPGSSYIIPACNTADNGHRANFEELINVQSQFEDILDASQDALTLPATLKNSELAIRDLRTLVRYSKLPSRRELDNEFEYFIQTANEASIDLTRYNARIGAVMDRVIITNTWTMNVLRGLEADDATIGPVSRALSAMTGAFLAPQPTLEQRIFDQYVLHISRNKEEISGLIEKAQALLMVLTNLDERLSTIFEIATSDDQTITRNQEELLSQLWTKLGGNRGDVNANRVSLNLLQNIGAYRKKAVMHVSQTLLQLQEIQAELENLREGVAAPEIQGYQDAVPLRYHLDLIEKGVERLKVSRGDSMIAEKDVRNRLMRGGEEGRGSRELPAPAVTVTAR